VDDREYANSGVTFEQLVRTALQLQIGVVVIFAPLPCVGENCVYPPVSPPRMRWSRVQELHVVRRYDLDFVDLWYDMYEIILPNAGKDAFASYFHDPVHPSERGHKLYGTFIARTLNVRLMHVLNVLCEVNRPALVLDASMSYNCTGGAALDMRSVPATSFTSTLRSATHRFTQPLRPFVSQLKRPTVLPSSVHVGNRHTDLRVFHCVECATMMHLHRRHESPRKFKWNSFPGQCQSVFRPWRHNLSSSWTVEPTKQGNLKYGWASHAASNSSIRFVVSDSVGGAHDRKSGVTSHLAPSTTHSTVALAFLTSWRSTMARALSWIGPCDSRDWTASAARTLRTSWTRSLESDARDRDGGGAGPRANATVIDHNMPWLSVEVGSQCTCVCVSSISGEIGPPPCDRLMPVCMLNGHVRSSNVTVERTVTFPSIDESSPPGGDDYSVYSGGSGATATVRRTRRGLACTARGHVRPHPHDGSATSVSSFSSTRRNTATTAADMPVCVHVQQITSGFFHIGGYFFTAVRV
jgi:hypothetical protein